MVVVGGKGEGGEVLSSVEVYGHPGLRVPALPEPRWGHVTFLSSSGELVTCLGSSPSCLVLAPGGGTWQAGVVADPSTRRIRAATVTTSMGTYVLGGVLTPQTSELLPPGGRARVPGPELPFSVHTGTSCSVALGGDAFLLIGLRKLREFGGEGWREGWPDLQVLLQVMGCSVLEERLVVVGEDMAGSLATEVVHLGTREVTRGASLLQGRRHFHLLTAPTGASEHRLMAVGGEEYGQTLEIRMQRRKNPKKLRAVEEWLPSTDTWMNLPALSEKRSDFGAVAVPALLRCLTEPDIPHSVTNCRGAVVGAECPVTCSTPHHLEDPTQASAVYGWHGRWVTRATCSGNTLIHIFYSF